MNIKIVLFLIGSLIVNIVNAQTDTSTKQCSCGGQTVYVRFGYDRNAKSQKDFSVRLDTAGKSIDYSNWRFVYNGEPDSLKNGVENEYVKTNSYYEKTFYYIPSNAIAYVIGTNGLVPYTKAFPVWYSDVLYDDPDAATYNIILCDKIENAKINNP